LVRELRLVLKEPATSTAPAPTGTVVSDPAFFNNRGWEFYQNGDYDKAISDYTEAIRLDSNYANAYYSRGLAYRKQGNEAQAQADFRKAKQLGYTGSQ
jgi:tetratricopeptide (TPR) repeat protein